MLDSCVPQRVTAALLMAPVFPARMAITCSDSRWSWSSFGVSNKIKTRSNLDSSALPILQSYREKMFLYYHIFNHNDITSIKMICISIGFIVEINSLEVLRDSFAFIIMSSHRIGCCDDGRSSWKCADDPGFSQTDALLLHGLQKSLMLTAHLIKLINTTHSCHKYNNSDSILMNPSLNFHLKKDYKKCFSGFLILYFS